MKTGSQYRPRSGWKQIAGAVYEHTTGTIVHLLGIIRLSNGVWLSANKWPESEEAKRFIRMNGGNRKRGLMGWAMAENIKNSCEAEVAAWNVKVMVGDTVEYRGYPEAEPQSFKTRTPAEVLSGHTAVVWLAGKSGCVCVEACRKLEHKR